MKCIVPSQNVKIVARAIHSLAKIGDELFIEPNENELVFCVLSLAQSAICYFRMSRSFFSSYSFTSDDNFSKCRIAMKSCLGVFKNPHCMDKQVESCEIRMKPHGSSVTFHIKYSNSSVKKHFIPTLENEVLEASYEKDAANKFVFPVKLLSSSMKNFRAAEDEVTIIVSQDKMIIKNCSVMKKDIHCMRTELTFHRSEFDCYNVNCPCGVTLCLKEMRSVIMFAEWSSLPILMQFNKPGDPIIFQVANPNVYEGTYVIQTLRKPSMEAEISLLSASITKTRDSSRQSENSVNVTASRSVKRKAVDSPRPIEAPPVFGERCERPVNEAGPSRTEEEASPSSNVVIPESEPVDVAEMQDPLPAEPTEGLETTIVATQPMEIENGPQPSDAPERTLPATQPMETSQPEPSHLDVAHNDVQNLIRIVFQRCFRQRYILDFHPGHRVVLADDSDKE